MLEASMQARRRSVPVKVGSVTVGGDAPGGGAVDDQHRHRRRRRDRPPGGGAGGRRLRDRAHHRRPRRGRRRRAEDQGAAAEDRLRRADRRRLPLHRPQAPGRSSRLRRGARQVPHQSRQRRLQGQEGPPVLRHRRDGDQARQAGAHRRQLGLARPGTADPPDGREFALEHAEGGARGHAARRWCSRRCCRPRAPRRSACRAQRSSSPPRSRRCRTWSQVYLELGTPLRLRHSSRPDRGRHGERRASSPRRRRSAFCCSRASATPSASRSRPSPAATARWR